MKKITFALAAAAAAALLATPLVRADDWEARVKISPDTLFRGVSIPSPFRGLDGKQHPGGLYDLKLHQGTQGILIGLLQGGKTIGEFPGKFVPADSRPDPDSKVGHDISVRKQDIHFDGSSKVGFVYGGAKGKISPSSNAHPGGVNLGFIWFELPAGQASGK